MLKMGMFAQHIAQEHEMEIEIPVVFCTQINRSVVLYDGGGIKSITAIFTVLLGKGRKIRTVHIE